MRRLATICLALAAPAAQADDQTIVSHGISTFGDLKYGPDFPHFDYVNPDAPKGGEFSMATIGTFDSFNLYARDGVTAPTGCAKVRIVLG
mgnify:CR=1 FL=1